MVVAAFALSYGLFEIATGALGDRIGTRKVLPRIVAWWSVFTCLTGAVSSAGEAGAFPNASASLSRWFPKTERARAHGVMWMASRLGGAITPLFVIPIPARYGWRASFYLFGVLGLAWAAAWYWWFRDRPSERAGISQREREEMARLQPIALPLRFPEGSPSAVPISGTSSSCITRSLTAATSMFRGGTLI
jgi:ACS family glucarate transporter-like MFS transporter